MCNPLREKAGAAPASCNNWFHSFTPPLLMSISSLSARLVPGPALGGRGQLGAGHTPLLPWRNSQSHEVDRPGKAESHPQRKVYLVEKTLDLAGTLALGVVFPWPCDRAATAEILPLGPAGTGHFGMGG